jgi:glycosyltransferase involved in cell wall biosynthesis
MFTTALVAMLNEYLHMPLVVTNHGFSVKRDPMFNFLESCYLNLIARRIFRRADYVFNFTQADRRHVISMGVSPNRAVVIPNGVDTDLFKPNTEAEDPHSILWVGRLVPEKGLEYLLGAMPEIINKIPQAKLRIVGYGDRTRLMSLISQLQLEPNVECLGVLEGKRLAHAINRCAVFVLPSLSEGLPTTLLEAMACAKPVVATEGIGLNEVLGQAGLYVSPRSESEIAKATVNLLRDRTLRLTLGRRARQTIEKEHSWYRTAPILERFYQNAVS